MSETQQHCSCMADPLLLQPFWLQATVQIFLCAASPSTGWCSSACRAPSSCAPQPAVSPVPLPGLRSCDAMKRGNDSCAAQPAVAGHSMKRVKEEEEGAPGNDSCAAQPAVAGHSMKRVKEEEGAPGSGAAQPAGPYPTVLMVACPELQQLPSTNDNMAREGAPR